MRDGKALPQLDQRVVQCLPIRVCVDVTLAKVACVLACKREVLHSTPARQAQQAAQFCPDGTTAMTIRASITDVMVAKKSPDTKLMQLVRTLVLLRNLLGIVLCSHKSHLLAS